MLFNTFEFFAFLILTLVAFRIVPARFRTLLITGVSWYFYSFWSLTFVSLIVFSTVVDHTVALRLERTDDPKWRRRLLGVSLVVNLGLLGYFKYRDFFLENLEAVLATASVSWGLDLAPIVLPVGISFYTFQTLGYTIDVYRRDIRACTSFFDFAAYVAFFPQLVAGPIERASRLLPQLIRPVAVDATAVAWSGRLILWGLFKKVFIADNLAPIVERVFDQAAPLDTGLALVGAYAFAFQIYCDFSGYTDIARGVARLFGVHLVKNFDRPYSALSVRDFWRRWHISLSTWLRDYLYISLGGNRGGETRTLVNLMITMVLGGLWHGASWMFLIWGAYQGGWLVLERLADRRGIGWTPDPTGWRRWLRILFVFQITCLGWVIFRSPTVEVMILWLEGLLTPGMGAETLGMWARFLGFAAPLMAVWWVQGTMNRRAPDKIENENQNENEVLPDGSRIVALSLQVLMILLLLLLGRDESREFIYFQF